MTPMNESSIVAFTSREDRICTGFSNGAPILGVGYPLAPPIAATRKQLKGITYGWVNLPKQSSVGKMTVCLDGVWLGAPGLADGSGL